MSDVAIEQPAVAKAPWHLWVVGILSLLWNLSGAYVIMSAQSGATMDMDAREIAYYASQPTWLAVATDVVLVAAILAALALLLRSRWAVHLYALSVVGYAVTAGYDIAAGTALFLLSQEWLIVECVIFCLSLLQLFYAMAMKGRGVLS